MTNHLTDEQLDALEHELKQGEVDPIEMLGLIDALRAERAAHQATRAVVGAARAVVDSWQSITREAEIERWMQLLCDAVEAYDAARVGQEDQ